LSNTASITTELKTSLRGPLVGEAAEVLDQYCERGKLVV
jgi:hypothetical protein